MSLLGIRELLTAGDPPLSQTGQLPFPLSQTSLRKAQWFNLCPMTDPFLKEMVEIIKEIAPMWHTWDMHTIMQQLHEAYQSKKPSCFKIREDTPKDMQAMLSLWQHNPEGVPTTIQQEDDGSLNLSHVDIWLGKQVGVTLTHVAKLEEYAACALAKTAHSSTSQLGKHLHKTAWTKDCLDCQK